MTVVHLRADIAVDHGKKTGQSEEWFMIRKAQYISLAVFLFSFTTCSSCAEKFNHIQIPESEAGQEDRMCVPCPKIKQR